MQKQVFGEVFDLTVDLLGGEAAFGRPATTLIDMHQVLIDGIPRAALEALMEKVPEMKNPETFEAVMGIEIDFYNEVREKLVLISRARSERIWSFANTLAFAASVLGGQSEAMQWMENPPGDLDRIQVFALLETDPGRRYLRRLIAGQDGD